MNSIKEKDWNFLFNLYNAFISHKQPVSLIQFVTERCNARCPHCFVDLKTQENELSLEQIEKISKTTGSALRNIALTGGEPFIRDDLFEIANIWYKNSSVKSISVSTNGSMPNKIEDFAKKCVELKIPVSFFFSYDFIGEKHSEFRRLKDLHLNVLESYKIIHNYFPKLNATFNITVNKDNYESAFETYKYMRDVLKIQNINCTMIRGENADILTPTERKNISDVYKQIQEALDNDFDKGLVVGYNDKSLTSHILNAKNKILWKYILKTFDENKYISPCSAGSLFGVIYSNGDVYPCELLKSCIGNLKDYGYDFMRCWESDVAKKVQKNIHCSKCFCTFECSWLINIFSSYRYMPEICYHIIRNLKR